MTYSDEDVQRLVIAAQEALDHTKAGWLQGILAEALFPFREKPDPDADLIKAMARGMRDADGPWAKAWEDTDDAGRGDWLGLARNALAAYREHTGETK